MLPKASRFRCWLGLWAGATSLAVAPSVLAGDNTGPVLEPSGWPQVAKVDRQFLAFNIEMAEVTGGDFWAPYEDPQRRRLAPRAPLALDDPRLVALVRGLAPAIIRVSGTWANSTYVPKATEVPPDRPPPGFGQVLHQNRWRALTSLARSSGNSLLLSFPASAGARTRDGAWSDEQAQRLVALTRAQHVPIRAVEFINEPNLVGLGSLPQGYRAQDYARDFRTFHKFARREVPGAVILGHSLSGRGGEMPSADIAREAGGQSDAVSYHFYGALSQRCAEFGNQTSRDDALTGPWLDRTEADRAWFAALRDRYDPGKPLWLTETAQAACGGDRWASTFRDSFRFVDQLGRLARSGVQVVAHNTLASGDYALIDRHNFAPRPNYWAAWLWRRTMGTIVLQPGIREDGVQVYAHCHAFRKGAVAAVVIVLAGTEKSVRLDRPALASTMTAEGLDKIVIAINGMSPRSDLLGRKSPPSRRVASGLQVLPAHSISFFEIPGAKNPACSQGR